MHVIAAKAVCFRLAMEPEFKVYVAQVVANAKALCRALADRGYRIVSGGTDNHLVLVDCKESRGVTGKDAERILNASGVTVNKNMIPFDQEKPLVTSGIRVGTAAVTTRGMKEPEMERIADAVDRVLSRPDDNEEHARVKAFVKELSAEFPLYPEFVEPWPTV